jgi:catechol 2,3-dioxygenase-like lactoylglutathione lyase family enzyme
MHPPIDKQITFVYTGDLRKSAEFYETVLELELWLDQGTCRIYRVSGSGMIGICQVGPGAKGHVSGDIQKNVILTLVTSAVDDWYDYLRERGVQFEKAPEANPKYRIYHCFLRDPDGYLIEIQRFD